ncbi:MAG: hypothetical protein FWD37_05170 [Methanomassiliicoccaceae archaeon]|nr:hypothetical protein [Methanomassiliicoccaceae archaeon]
MGFLDGIKKSLSGKGSIGSKQWPPEDKGKTKQKVQVNGDLRPMEGSPHTSKFPKRGSAKMAGHIKAGTYWTKEDERMLRDMYLNGKTVPEISAALGRTEDGIRYRLVKFGLASDINSVADVYSGSR